MVFRGEPGIGKSRLAAAAAELVEASGAVVLELVGSPFHTDAGLHPVRTLLERRCGIGRAHRSGRTAATAAKPRCAARVRLDPVTVVPLLAPVLGIGAEAGYEPVPAEGRKLYELIAASGAGLSAGLPGRRCGVGGGRGCALVRPVHPRGARLAAERGRGSAAGGDHRTARWVAAGRLAGQGVRPDAVDRRADRRADHRAESEA